MADLIPEPPDRTIALMGPEGYERVYMRDDSGVADTDSDHWWAMPSKVGDDPLSWPDVRAFGTVRLYYPQDEVDRLVAEARRFGLNMAVHSPEEIARLEGRLAEEGRSDG